MPYENHIIDYLADSGFKLGLVVRDQKNKLLVTDRNGRSESVQLKRLVIDHGAVSGADTAALATVEDRVTSHTEGIDTDLLWESAALEAQDETATDTEALCELFFGTTSPELISATVRALALDPLRFKRSGREFRPRTPEEFTALQLQQQRRQEREERRDRAVTWIRDVVAGRCTDERDCADVARIVEDYVLLGHSNDAQGFLELAEPRTPPRKTGVQVLDTLGRLPADADRFLLEKGVLAGFSERVEALAAALEPYTSPDGAAPLVDAVTFSIDDDETREVDDALTVRLLPDGGTEVRIHIADPSRFVHRDDPFDQVARERPLTLYLPTTTVTMLPERIGCDLASLRPGVVRPTLTVRVLFDADGAILESDLAAGEVVNGQRLTYEEADALIANTDQGSCGPALERLYSLALGLESARLERGAVILRKPEPKVRVKNGTITVTPQSPDSAANALVSEFMILANRLAAEFALSQDVPVIYRMQDPPAGRVPPMRAYDPIVFDNAVRQMRRTRFTTHPQPHAGLGVEVYIQISSPIRRYADLVLHRQLAAYLEDLPLPYEVTELVEVLGAAEAMERLNREMERESSGYWLLEYLRRGQAGDELEGTVVHDRRGTTVELDVLGVRGRLSGTAAPKPGSRVRVRLERVESGAGVLVLGLCTEEQCT
jgi:exoribonuclease-2